MAMCIVTSSDKCIFEESNSFDVKHDIHAHEVVGLKKEDWKEVFTSYAFGGIDNV